MQYFGMPMGIWMLFAASFERNTVSVLGFDHSAARQIREEAKAEYRKIIDRLPTFEKGDRFQMNLLSCAMLAAFYLHMTPHPSVEQMTVFYREAMMTKPMRWFCRMSGRRKFSEKDVAKMQQTEAFRAADRNPYSWNMTYLPYPDGSGYEARFTHCGICTLMKELGMFAVVPAMCALDYAMSEAGGRSDFVREYTLATGARTATAATKERKNRHERQIIFDETGTFATRFPGDLGIRLAGLSAIKISGRNMTSGNASADNKFYCVLNRDLLYYNQGAEKSIGSAAARRLQR